MSKSKDDHLAGVPLFARMSTKERLELGNLFTEVEVPANTVLAKQGSTGHEFFLILTGSAAVDRDGHRLAEVGPGNFQGEISLLDGGPRTATVTASTAMTILVASHQEFNSLLDRAPTLARQMLPALAHRVRALTEDAVSH